ncbi:MAG: type IV pilus assembly protein PilM [candidate division Zixibacteria bacterium]|nr:type IV pilus assembly protein PilM [candidate division Zixibacteria bacterium]
MAKSVIGLDIGTFAIKLVELEKEGGRYKVKNFFIKDIYNPGEEFDPEGPGVSRLESSIKEVFQAVKLNPKRLRNVNTSLGGPSVSVKQIKSIALAPEEMESSLVFEARKHLPLDESDAVIDSQILRGDMDSQDMDIMLVATTKKVFDNHLSLLKSLGIKSNIIDAENLALVNSYFITQGSLLGEEAIAFLNVGAKYSNIAIVGENTMLFTRDINWAGINFTDDIKGSLDVDYTEAESIKKDRGIGALVGGGQTANGGGIRVARRMAIDNLIDEIRRSLRYYTKETGCRNFQKILLCGGSSALPNLNSHLAQHLNMTVEIYNPFAGFITPPGLDENTGTRLAVACGLALRED